MNGGMEETGLNYIYSKSYNFVYMRAKAILGDEQAARGLMREVYTAFYKKAEKTKVDALYEEIGRNVYRMGCACIKEKRQKEAHNLILSEGELKKEKIDMSPEELEEAWDALEKMPDLYFATAIAFYYDYLAIDEIAELFSCTPNAVRYRLNYMRKCLEDILREDKKFSAALVCTVIRAWATEHCMALTGAQNTYVEICEVIGLEATPVYLAGKDFAGVNHTVVYRPQHDWDSLLSELEPEEPERRNMKPYLWGGVAAVVIALCVVIVLAIMPRKNADKGTPETPKAEQTIPKTDEPTEPKADETTEPKTDEPSDPKVDESKSDEPTADEKSEPEVDDTQAGNTDTGEDITKKPEQTKPVANEYIFADSDKVLISTSALDKCTKAQLRLARNEIYARHGVVFDIEDLDEYFQSKSWYKAKMSITEFYDKVEMNEVEEENIIRIQKAEQAK